jgi:uncharacterized Zn-finger protein
MFSGEQEFVNKKSVKCEGKDNLSDHPLVYLEINPTVNNVICPYCSKKFIYQE